MFTGLVQHLGHVRSVSPSAAGATLIIDPAGWDHRPDSGASIAVNGVCLTVTSPTPGTDLGGSGGLLAFDVVSETLARTTLGGLAAGSRVNLEHAVTASTLLGGHIVQGHVDGVAVVTEVAGAEADRRLRIEPPPALMDTIIQKGSVAVDGVSLTVAALDGVGFEIALIPTTIAETTLGAVQPGDHVNIETDYVAKTVVHWLERSATPQSG